jgi:hypothetical protein
MIKKVEHGLICRKPIENSLKTTVTFLRLSYAALLLCNREPESYRLRMFRSQLLTQARRRFCYTTQACHAAAQCGQATGKEKAQRSPCCIILCSGCFRGHRRAAFPSTQA